MAKNYPDSSSSAPSTSTDGDSRKTKTDSSRTAVAWFKGGMETVKAPDTNGMKLGSSSVSEFECGVTNLSNWIMRFRVRV